MAEKKYIKQTSEEERSFETWLRTTVFRKVKSDIDYYNLNEDDLCQGVRKWMKKHKKNATFRDLMNMKWIDMESINTLNLGFVIEELGNEYRKYHHAKMDEFLSSKRFTLEQKVCIKMWMESVYPKSSAKDCCPFSIQFFVRIQQSQFWSSYLSPSTLRKLEGCQESLKQTLEDEDENRWQEMLDEVEKEFDTEKQELSPASQYHVKLS